MSAVRKEAALAKGYDVGKDIYGWHALKDGYPLGMKGRPWKEGHGYFTEEEAWRAAINAAEKGYLP
jgi:hypothetical protein